MNQSGRPVRVGFPMRFFGPLRGICGGPCHPHARLGDERGRVRSERSRIDLLSTRLYPLDDKLAMYVDSVQKADSVTAERIINEANRWGMNRRIAEEIVADSLDRLPAAIKQATEEIDALPDTLPELVNKRVDQLLSTTLPSDRA